MPKEKQLCELAQQNLEKVSTEVWAVKVFSVCECVCVCVEKSSKRIKYPERLSSRFPPKVYFAGLVTAQ